jgi:hypothetical protein
MKREPRKQLTDAGFSDGDPDWVYRTYIWRLADLIVLGAGTAARRTIARISGISAASRARIPDRVRNDIAQGLHETAPVMKTILANARSITSTTFVG